MNYDKFIDIIKNSNVEEWNVIGCWGYGAGPSYKSKFEFYEMWDGKQSVLKEESHSMYAVYKPDINISLAFGLTVNENFKEKWANSFPDPQASSQFVDLFYANTLVERIVYVVVDGGRAKLPLPISIKNLKVNPNEYYIIRLIDNMESAKDNFEKYFKQAGLIL